MGAAGMKTRYVWLQGFSRPVKLFVGDDTPGASIAKLQDMWLDTKTNTWKVWNGSAWVAGAIADGSVVVAKLADNAVETAKIKDAQVTTAKLADNVLSANAAGRGKIQDGIFDAATVTAKVADKAIDRRKLGVKTVVTESTAGNVTFTAANVLNGLIERDPNGGARTDVLPTAALLVAGITSPFVGQEIEFLVVNTADASETITLNVGVGGTAKPPTPGSIAQNAVRRHTIKLTNVTSGTEAYTCYYGV